MSGCADAGSPIPLGDASARLATLTIDDFTPCLGQVFRLSHEGEAVELVLQAADPTGVPGLQGGRAGFSLVFLGSGTRVLSQRIYRLEHPALGILEIFLGPLGREEGQVRYEAVFG